MSAKIEGRARICKEGLGKCAVGSPFDPFDAGDTANAGGQNLGDYPNAVSSVFGGAGQLTVAKPPAGLLFVGAAIAVAGGALAGICWTSWIALIGWVLAGPVAIGVMASYVARDTARRAEPVYLRPDWLTMAYAVASTLGVIGILVSSLSVAFWVGRL